MLPNWHTSDSVLNDRARWFLLHQFEEFPRQCQSKEEVVPLLHHGQCLLARAQTFLPQW